MANLMLPQLLLLRVCLNFMVLFCMEREASEIKLDNILVLKIILILKLSLNFKKWIIYNWKHFVKKLRNSKKKKNCLLGKTHTSLIKTLDVSLHHNCFIENNLTPDSEVEVGLRALFENKSKFFYYLFHMYLCLF